MKIKIAKIRKATQKHSEWLFSLGKYTIKKHKALKINTSQFIIHHHWCSKDKV